MSSKKVTPKAAAKAPAKKAAPAAKAPAKSAKPEAKAPAKKTAAASSAKKPAAAVKAPAKNAAPKASESKKAAPVAKVAAKSAKTEPKKAAPAPKVAAKAPAKSAPAKVAESKSASAAKPAKASAKAAPAKATESKSAPAAKPAKASAKAAPAKATESKAAPAAKPAKVSAKAAPAKAPKAEPKKDDASSKSAKAAEAKAADAKAAPKTAEAKTAEAPAAKSKTPATSEPAKPAGKVEVKAEPKNNGSILMEGVKKLSKTIMFIEIDEQEDRTNKKKMSSEMKSLEMKPTSAIRHKASLAEETQEELTERILKELEEQNRAFEREAASQMCTRCNRNLVSPEFWVDKHLGYCEECAMILKLGQSKEARKVEYQLGGMGDSLDEEDDDIMGPDADDLKDAEEDLADMED